jgi:hypothetical protein
MKDNFDLKKYLVENKATTQSQLNENTKYLCTKDVKIGNRFYTANDVITDEVYNSLDDEQKENFRVFPKYLEKLINDRNSRYNTSNTRNRSNSSLPWDYTINPNDL